MAKIETLSRRAQRNTLRIITFLSVVCLVAALATGGAAISAYRQPAMTATEHPGIVVSQSGRYTWTAGLAPNSLYGSNRVDDPDLVYGSITERFTVRFSYDADAGNATAVAGTCGFTLTVTAADGWSKVQRISELRPLVVSPDAASTARYSWAYNLSLAELDRIIAAVGRETGESASEYTVTLSPMLSLTASGGGEQLAAAFTAPLVMHWRPDLHRLAMPAEREFSAPDMRTASHYTSAATPFLIAGRGLAFGGTALPVGAARLWLPGLSGILFIGTGLLLLQRSRLALRSDPRFRQRQLEHRYPGLFVSGSGGLPDGSLVIELASLQDLAHTARLLSRPVIHVPDGDFHYVLDGHLAYCCGRPGQVAVRVRPASVPARRRKRGPSSFTDAGMLKPNQTA